MSNIMEPTSQNKLLLWTKYLIRIILITVNNIYCIPTHAFILLLFYPIFIISPSTFYKIEETMFTWLLSMVSCWSYSAGYQIAESGDSLDQSMKEKILFMPNHQSTADVPFLMTIFSPRNGYSGKVMWLMDKVFKFTNFGVVSWIHDDFFIQAGKSTRDQSLRELRTHLRKVFIDKDRDCLVLFPEGGFLRKRKAVSQSFAKKMDLPQLEYCTIPRTGALDVIMEELGPNATSPIESRITKVVDVTIAYPEGKPLDLQSIITGWRNPCTTYVHYRVFDTSEVPQDSAEIFKWMVDKYEEKERMLKEFYETGEFPYKMFDPDASPPTVIQHNAALYTLRHIFFIAVFVALFYYLVQPCITLIRLMF